MTKILKLKLKIENQGMQKPKNLIQLIKILELDK